jgi:MoxR-like ATPase
MAAGKNILGFGAAGTGKSSFWRALAALLGRPYFQIGFHAETSTAELFGFQGPEGEGMAWVPGDLLIAMQTPFAMIDLSEISFARPELTAQLLSVLEATDRSVLAGGTRYHVHPTARFFASSNDNGSGENSHRYHGTRALNPALVSRFGFRVEFKSPNESRFAKMVARTTGIDLAAAQNIAAFEKTIEKGMKAGDCEATPGVRAALDWSDMVLAGTPSKEAFEFCVINSAPSDDAAYWGQQAAALDPHTAIDAAANGQPIPTPVEAEAAPETRNGFTATE